MKKIELQSPYTELVFKFSTNRIVFVDENYRQNDQLEIRNIPFQILSVENYSLNSAPCSVFENIGLKRKNGIIGKYKNYNFISVRRAFKQEEFIFSVAKISFISLLDSLEFDYDLSSQIQFIQLQKL